MELLILVAVICVGTMVIDVILNTLYVKSLSYPSHEMFPPGRSRRKQIRKANKQKPLSGHRTVVDAIIRACIESSQVKELRATSISFENGYIFDTSIFQLYGVILDVPESDLSSERTLVYRHPSAEGAYLLYDFIQSYVKGRYA